MNKLQNNIKRYKNRFIWRKIGTNKLTTELIACNYAMRSFNPSDVRLCDEQISTHLLKKFQFHITPVTTINIDIIKEI